MGTMIHSLRNALVAGGLGVLGSIASAPAQALALTPADMIAASLGNSNCEPGCIYTAFGISSPPALTLYYKADVGDAAAPATVESGTFVTSYETTFSNSPLDPADALIDYISGASIPCPECYLAIKDGNHDPSYYFYNLAGWNGTDDISLTGFWPGQGAISHVSIWGRDDGGPPVLIPEPGSLALLGLGLLGLGLATRRKQP